MSNLLADYETKVLKCIADDAEQLGSTAPDRFDKFIAEAVAGYSRNRPRTLVKDWTGDDTYDYDMPATFLEGFSMVVSVEHDVGDQVPSFVDARYWIVYRSATDTLVLRFLDRSPTTTETVRMTYSGVHTVSASVGSISDVDFDAVCNLACAGACRAESSRYSEKMDSSISADSVNFRSLAKEWADLAKGYLAAYREHLTAPTDGTAAVLTKNLDSRAVVSGSAQDFMFHERRLR